MMKELEKLLKSKELRAFVDKILDVFLKTEKDEKKK